MSTVETSLSLARSPGVHVEKVIEEAVLVRRAGEEAQGREHPLAGGRARDVAAIDTDRIGGEPEAHRRDARE